MNLYKFIQGAHKLFPRTLNRNVLYQLCLKNEYLQFHADVKCLQNAPRRYFLSRQTHLSKSCVTLLMIMIIGLHNSGSVFGNGGTLPLSTKPNRRKSHTVRSGNWDGHVQKMLSELPQRLSHRPVGVHLSTSGPRNANMAEPRR